MKPLRTLSLILIFTTITFGCALCALFTPTAHVDIKFDTNESIIKRVNFVWTFSENFSELTMNDYDLNSDKILDKNELGEIEKALIIYLKPRNYLTSAAFYDKSDMQNHAITQKDVKYKVYFEENRLKFNFSFLLNLEARKERVLSFNIFDKEGFFNFKISEIKPLKLNDDVYLIDNVNLNIVFYEMTTKSRAAEHLNKPSLKSLVENPDKIYDEIDAIDSKKIDEISKISIGFLDKLKELFKENSRNFTPLSLMAILAFSFIYGFLHAAGPGHGKMLTGSYFAASGGDSIKALNFALKVGFLHVIGAFLLVFVMFFILSKISNAKNISMLTTQISGIAIIIIAIFLLIKKIKKIIDERKMRKKFIWRTHPKSCDCHVCQSLQTEPKNYYDWLIAAAAALIPCPGTLIVFILAFELGSYFIAMISAVFMALGMSSVIFISAIAGVGINALAKFKNFAIFAEILALSVMIALGIFMIMISAKMAIL